MILGPRFHLKNWKLPWRKSKVPIEAKCLDTRFHHFVSADAKLYPCCFVRVGGCHEELRRLLGEDYALLDLKKYSFEEIVRSRAWKKILRSIRGPQPMAACVRICAVERTLKDRPDSQHDGRNRFVRFNT